MFQCFASSLRANLMEVTRAEKSSNSLSCSSHQPSSPRRNYTFQTTFGNMGKKDLWQKWNIGFPAKSRALNQETDCNFLTGSRPWEHRFITHSMLRRQDQRWEHHVLDTQGQRTHESEHQAQGYTQQSKYRSNLILLPTISWSTTHANHISTNLLLRDPAPDWPLTSQISRGGQTQRD